MKISFLFVAVLVLFLSACSSSSDFLVGRDFNSKNIEKIEKGATTSQQLVLLFGEPFQKSVVSATKEKWIYTSTAGTVDVSLGGHKTTGATRSLDILIDDGVVINFAFTESPMSQSNVN